MLRTGTPVSKMLTSRDHASMRWTRVVTNRPSGPKPFGPDIKFE